MANLNMNLTEQAIYSDVLQMIRTQALSTSLGRGVPTAAAVAALPSMPVSEVVLTYADGRKFVVQVDVRQINTNSGRV